MEEGSLSLPENPIGLALLESLESGLDGLFQKTTSDGHASEIVELVPVGYNENGSLVYEIDTNEELKEDSNKNLTDKDADISIVAETIPKRSLDSLESVFDKTKDSSVQHSDEPSRKKQKGKKPILKQKEMTGYFLKKQVPMTSNEVIESRQLRPPIALTVPVPFPPMELFEHQTNVSAEIVEIL